MPNFQRTTVPLFPIVLSASQQMTISDDDLCATCQHCRYNPGEESGCAVGWPGHQDADGYVQACEQHERCLPGANLEAS